MTFGSFEKPKNIISSSDLEQFIHNEVAEGYWNECKSDFVKNLKVAQSTAYLDYSYRGWHFVGIDADKTTNLPAELSGFDISMTKDTVVMVRDIIKSSIDPVPIYESKLMPFDSVRTILVVFVADNQETPFVTRDDRIYRRASDSSEPVAETNRYASDRPVDNPMFWMLRRCPE